MLHTTRKWGVSPCEADELVTKLKDYSWMLCSAFQTPAGTIWANDSTSPDAIQEYAVLRPDGAGDFQQIETITVDWCKADKLQSYIEEYDAEAYPKPVFPFGTFPAASFEMEHEPCCYCQ